MKRFIFLFYIFGLLLTSVAQNEDGQQQIQFNVTEDLVYTEDFTGAIRMYKQMISFDPKNPAFYYRLGFAYLNTFGKQDSALFYLQKADELYDPKYRSDVSPFEVKFYLARAYRLNNKIDSSIIILETLRTETFNEQFMLSINCELEKTRNFLNNLFTVENLDSIINSAYTDHSPVFCEDENILIFTSRRFHDNNSKYDDGQYDEEIYFSKINDAQWTDPVKLDVFSTPNNEASVNFGHTSKELLIYKDDDNGSIYLSKYSNDKWSAPLKLPKPINTRHRETHASMTTDGSIIYFTSDRGGGYGGLDIWCSVKLATGEWSKAINLGPGVNSKGDEESPNISFDGNTLYFSSDGRDKSFGGFDIYKSTKTEFNTWGYAENIGYPINSIGDDIFFTPIISTEKAFYTSYRYGSKGKADIFIVYLDSTNVNKQTINIGYVYDQNEQPINDVEICITNTKTSEKRIAKPAQTGKFIFVTEANNSYSIDVNYNNQVVFTDLITFPDTVPSKKFYRTIVINVN